MMRARISQSHQMQFSAIGKLNAWGPRCFDVSPFSLWLKGVPYCPVLGKAVDTTCPACHFTQLALLGEKAMLKA